MSDWDGRAPEDGWWWIYPQVPWGNIAPAECRGALWFSTEWPCFPDGISQEKIADQYTLGPRCVMPDRRVHEAILEAAFAFEERMIVAREKYEAALREHKFIPTERRVEQEMML